MDQHLVNLMHELANATSTVPVELYEPLPELIVVDGPNPHRLCSPDNECGHGDAGCRRTDTILAWEAENPGQYLPANLVWAVGDSYFVHDGKMFYDKKFLQEKFDKEYRDMLDQHMETGANCILADIESIDPSLVPVFNVSVHKDMEFVRKLIKARPSGLPPFIKETEKFFVFKDVTNAQVTAANITPEILQKIYNTFIVSNPSNFYCFGYEPVTHLFSHYYLSSDKYFFTDLNQWIECTTPEAKRVAIMGLPLEYEDAIVFHPFQSESNLSDSERELLYFFGTQVSSETGKPFEIRDL